LSTVHDKMDNSKTYIPRLGKKAKAIGNVMNFLISLTSMLTHGHKTGGFSHFNLSSLEKGSNFIVTSLAKCIKDVDEAMVDQYGDLFYKRETLKHPLHEALLQFKSYEKCLIYKQDDMQAHETSVDNTNFCKENRKLPPILLMQMNNCARNNKNHYVLKFVSLLTSRRVFDIIEVGFLPVEYTHEDLDETYGKLSTKLM
jgi:hypothetical protein